VALTQGLAEPRIAAPTLLSSVIPMWCFSSCPVMRSTRIGKV